MTGRFAAVPRHPAGVGVLVLSGSSGRVETDRARLFADHGAHAVSVRWFGGAGQPPGICEVPLEPFLIEVDALAADCDRIGVVGVSKGAEAALLLAAVDPRVTPVALAPSSVVWANLGPGYDGRLRPCRSSWTWQGEPLPFVPYDDAVEPVGDPPSYAGVYRASLRTHADHVDAARIPVERIAGEVVLVAGGDDRMWPSVDFAREIVEPRADAGLTTRLVTHPDAGHRVRFPGEPVLPRSTVNAHGGTPEADAALGAAAWPVVLAALGLRIPG